MAAKYRWTITRDLLADTTAPEKTNSNAKGMTGPRGASKEVTDNPARFTMYDGDLECYYHGMIFGDYSGFEPLDDFGMPNAGCTDIAIDGELM